VVIQQEGAAFTDFQTRCDEIRYHMTYYITIQLSQLDVPQYRDRLWCFPVRKDVADAIVGPHYCSHQQQQYRQESATFCEGTRHTTKQSCQHRR
jgi:hypothetical protein